MPPSPGRKGGGDGQREVVAGDREQTSYQARLSLPDDWASLAALFVV